MYDFFLLFFVISTAQANPSECSSITMDISVSPSFYPKNTCNTKDFSCHTPTYSLAEQHYTYEQKCSMKNISAYQDRLEHYKLIQHNGAVIVGDHLESCVKGGIQSIEKKYNKGKYTELFEARYDVGESAPRISLLSYEDGVYSNSTIESEGKVLPICTKIVKISSTRGKRPDTQLVQLHCGNPSELINKCYVLPNSNTPRILQIDMREKSSKKLSAVFEDLKFPSYAIDDMNYRIENGCFNQGNVPMNRLDYSWNLPKSDLQKVFSSCVDSNGFSFAKSALFDILEGESKDFSAFNFEDIQILEENLVEDKGTFTYLQPSVIEKQIPIAQERQKKYKQCMNSLEDKYNHIKNNKVFEQFRLLTQQYYDIVKEQNQIQAMIVNNHNQIKDILPSKYKNISNLHETLHQEQEILRILFVENSYLFEEDVDKLTTSLNHFIETQAQKLIQEQLFVEGQQIELEKEQVLFKNYQEQTQPIVDAISEILDLKFQKLSSIEITDIPYSTEGIATCEAQLQELDRWQMQLESQIEKVHHLEKHVFILREKTELYEKLLTKSQNTYSEIEQRNLVFESLERKSFVATIKIHPYTRGQTYYFEHKEKIDIIVWNSFKISLRLVFFFA